MHFHCKLFSVNRMFTRRMEVELHSSGSEVEVRVVMVEQTSSVSRVEVFAVVQSHLVRSPCPHVFKHLLHVLLVRVLVVLVIKLYLFERRVVGCVSKQSDWRLFFTLPSHFPICPVSSMIFVVKRLKLFVLIIVSLLTIWNP